MTQFICSDPGVINLFSCSTQQSMKFILPINVKMPQYYCLNFSIYEQDQENVLFGRMNEPCHEKTGFWHMRKQRLSTFVFATWIVRSFFYLNPKFQAASTEPSSVAVQPGLCRTWSETPKTGFLMTRLK